MVKIKSKDQRGNRLKMQKRKCDFCPKCKGPLIRAYLLLHLFSSSNDGFLHNCKNPTNYNLALCIISGEKSSVSTTLNHGFKDNFVLINPLWGTDIILIICPLTCVKYIRLLVLIYIYITHKHIFPYQLKSSNMRS